MFLLLQKMLPSWIYRRLIGNWDKEGVKKYVHNTGWLFLARGATFITSFFTIAIVARYLGPENLGKLSYAQSFVSILSVFASLGIDQILYRDLTAHPEQENELLGTAIFSKLFFGAVAFITAISISFLMGNEPILTLLIGIVAFTFLINPLGTVGILFQSKVQAKYTSYIAIFLAFFIPLLKVLIIYFDKGIIYFAGTLIIEATIMVLWSIYTYVSKFYFTPYNWRFSLLTFKRLMRDSWPFLFAGFFSYLYARTDQIMLQHYLGSRSVGLYDIAVRLTNIWSFVPALIITSLFPAIVRSKQTNQSIYLQRFGSLSILIVTIASVITILIFFISKPLVLSIFGEQYLASISVLRIYIWSGTIAILGILVQQYLVTENKGRTHLFLTLLGACINILLNLYMIPYYGITGAAISTVISFTVVPIGIMFYRQARNDVLVMFNIHK